MGALRDVAQGVTTDILVPAVLAEAHGLQCELHTTTMGTMDIANLHVSCAIDNQCLEHKVTSC